MRAASTSEQRREQSLKILNTVGLDGFQAAYPRSSPGECGSGWDSPARWWCQPEVLFMDEPFSALDVLTAENLRSELLELWHKKTIPRSPSFWSRITLKRPLLLADRIIVLGRNPGHVRVDLR